MQIAVFGGSFDPVHMGHISIVNEAIKSLDIDKIIIVPTYLNPFKKSFQLEPNSRKNLLKKVFQKTPKVEVSDYEINQKKAVYSIETIKYLKDLYKPSKIYFIIGADNLSTLDKWHKIDEVKDLVEFVVAKREGYNTEELMQYKTLDVNIDISSTQLRKSIDFRYIPNEIAEDMKNLQNKNKG